MKCTFCEMEFEGEVCPICGTKAEKNTEAEKERERLAYERAKQARERAQARNSQSDGAYNRFCSHCGGGVNDDAVVCVHCGRSLDGATTAASSLGVNSQGLQSAIKILMIIGTVLMAMETLGLALIWCLPMYSHYTEKMKRGEKVSVTFKVCTTLFINTIAGILMFLDGNI